MTLTFGMYGLCRKKERNVDWKALTDEWQSINNDDEDDF